jgi:hypothetical protein
MKIKKHKKISKKEIIVSIKVESFFIDILQLFLIRQHMADKNKIYNKCF